MVYKAQDLALGRLVAVKILREPLTGDPEFLARFQQEARAAANLAHPNIVTVHDFGRDGGRNYIVMEYIEGKDLKTLSRKARPSGMERALDLTIQICAGIGYAHRAGLVHCDVKPQNMLVTADGRLKVTDFGIARALASIQPGRDHRRGVGQPAVLLARAGRRRGPHPGQRRVFHRHGDVRDAGRPAAVCGQHPAGAGHDAPARRAAAADPVQPRPARSPGARGAQGAGQGALGPYRTADQLGRILIRTASAGWKPPARSRGRAKRTGTPALGTVAQTVVPPPPPGRIFPEAPTAYRQPTRSVVADSTCAPATRRSARICGRRRPGLGGGGAGAPGFRLRGGAHPLLAARFLGVFPALRVTRWRRGRSAEDAVRLLRSAPTSLSAAPPTTQTNERRPGGRRSCDAALSLNHPRSQVVNWQEERSSAQRATC